MKIYCKICGAPIDLKTATAITNTPFIWLCASENCKAVWQQRQEANRKREREQRNREVKANLKKYGKGLR